MLSVCDVGGSIHSGAQRCRAALSDAVPTVCIVVVGVTAITSIFYVVVVIVVVVSIGIIIAAIDPAAAGIRSEAPRVGNAASAQWSR